MKSFNERPFCMPANWKVDKNTKPKDQERAEIAKKTEAFLKKGGIVKKYPQGASGVKLTGMTKFYLRGLKNL